MPHESPSSAATAGSPRNWWSLSSKHSNPEKDYHSFYPDKQHLTRAKSSSSNINFNSLASAIGFKQKKQPPALAIQDPPPRTIHHDARSPNITPVLERRPQQTYTNRPPSKSVSSTIRSSEEPGPITPADPHRHSLLTLSDIDPFAAGARSPVIPNDPNRLSVYSSASGQEYVSKKFDIPVVNSRSSYGSSSSTSHRDHMSSHVPPSPVSPVDSVKPSRSRKTSAIHRSDSKHRPRDVWEPTPSSTISADMNRFSQPPPPPAPQPKMRARGMTEVGMVQSLQQFLREESPPRTKPRGKTPPRVVVRQASLSRIGQPPSAPPVHDLPMPPSIDEGNDGDEHIGNSSASSSSISFALTRDSFANQSYNPRLKQSRNEPEPHSVNSSAKKPVSSRMNSGSSTPISPQSPHSPPRTLKKAASHQSLKRGSASSTTSVPVPDQYPPIEKTPKKQRSFHHPRLPLPPLPLPSLRHANSFTPSSPPDNPNITEQRRGSASSINTPRKRLFSGPNSRRPSTSQSVMSSDDDVRSVFSLPGEIEHAYNTFASSGITQPSFWDEGHSDVVPSSPMTEYTPQRIMSHAEMLKIEASVREGGTYVRPRGQSLVAAPTPAENSTSFSPVSSPPPPRHGFARSSSLMGQGLLKPSTSSPTTPSTSRSSSPPLYTSLSPPPRPRPRQHLPFSHDDEPPVRASNTPIAASTPPPVQHAPTPKLSAEQLKRQALLRKPSFLDIDFEPDADNLSASTLHGDSFLDFNRSSFDTLRSIDD